MSKDNQLQDEFDEIRDLFNDYFDRFGDIYYWELARKARAIALAAFLTNLLVCLNAGFFVFIKPSGLSIDYLVADWAYRISGGFSLIFLGMTILSHICFKLKLFQHGILLLTLTILTVTLSLFSSYVGFFDGLTWFIFYTYTAIGFVLLNWRQVITTDFTIIFLMVLITIFHESFPYPVQAYMFSSNENIASMSFIDLLAAWTMLATSSFTAVWVIGFLMRNWHQHGTGESIRSNIDALTKVLKRRAVLESLEHEVLNAAREHKDLAVAVIDLDYFKEVNKDHGHVFGDAVLAHVAEKITSVTREHDFVGRYGGQEFLVVFPGCSIPVALKVITRLQTLLYEEPLPTESGERAVVTFSAGLSRLRPGDSKYENIIARADIALGKAKEQGRDKIIVDDS